MFALPCMDKTSTSVIHILQNTIIPHFGCPKAVVTDLGVENKNSEVEQLLTSYKIKHITSSRAHPQSNGLVERRQRMLLLAYTLILSPTKIYGTFASPCACLFSILLTLPVANSLPSFSPFSATLVSLTTLYSTNHSIITSNPQSASN